MFGRPISWLVVWCLAGCLLAANRPAEDPIAPLGEGDAAALAKPTPAVIKTLIGHYVDRIEAWHIQHSQPAPELLAYFKANPAARYEFWLALNPHDDDAAAALQIMETLRAKDPAKLTKFLHLAIAMAVVYDQPKNLYFSRHYSLWAVVDSQFGDTLSYGELYDFFTDPKRQALFAFRPETLAWPLMVQLVDLDVNRAEIDWATASFGKEVKHLDLEELYDLVPYDFLKLKTRSQTTLSNRPYILENLKQYGGVCVDRAHFASRVAKIFGIPALKCVGEGRYGSSSLHAWGGYLSVDPQTRFPILSFTGRYSECYYFTGTAFDPQSGELVMDRQIELLYDGVSGRYESYIQAATLTRMALKLETDQPAVALTLVKEALRINGYVVEAWKLEMRLAKTGTMPGRDADRAYQRLVDTMSQRHADLCVWCFDDYLASIPADQDAKRQQIYLGVYAVLGKAKRPDLQIEIRLKQLAELAKNNRSKDVIQLAFDAVGPNITQGSLVMPLVEQLVKLSHQFAAQDKTFHIEVVRASLKKYAQDFPQFLGEDISPAWVEYQKLMESL